MSRTVHLLSIYMSLTNKFLFCYSCVTQNLNVRYKYLYIKDIKFILIFEGKEIMAAGSPVTPQSSPIIPSHEITRQSTASVRPASGARGPTEQSHVASRRDESPRGRRRAPAHSLQIRCQHGLFHHPGQARRPQETSSAANESLKSHYPVYLIFTHKICQNTSK